MMPVVRLMPVTGQKLPTGQLAATPAIQLLPSGQSEVQGVVRPALLVLPAAHAAIDSESMQ